MDNEETTEIINIGGNSKSITYNIDDEVLNKDPFDPKFYITEGNKTTMIKYFEKHIRDSFEYRWLIDTYKRTLNVKSCVFFKGYSIENGMKLEFHHHPFTLYDYVEAVVNRQLEQNCDNFVYENEVCSESVKIHYHLNVGLVPLDPTSHGQVHDHVLDIPPELVIGNYENFFIEYNNYIPECTKSKYLEWLRNYPKGCELEYPENFKFKPTIINADNKHLISVEKINQLFIADKLQNVNNEYINKLLEQKEK